MEKLLLEGNNNNDMDLRGEKGIEGAEDINNDDDNLFRIYYKNIEISFLSTKLSRIF